MTFRNQKFATALIVASLLAPTLLTLPSHAATFVDGAHVEAPHRIRYANRVYSNRRLIRRQAKYQMNKRFARKFRKQMSKVIRQNRKAVMREPIKRDDHSYTNTRWFKDGLSRRNLKARDWVSFHESSHRWNVLSYGKVCIGYFQLNPEYLGYRHHHVNLNHKHQVQVADAYVKLRYGSWVKAEKFWKAHEWY